MNPDKPALALAQNKPARLAPELAVDQCILMAAAIRQCVYSREDKGWPMESQIAKEIRQNLERYLNGEIELCSFENFFVPVLWNIDERNDIEATQLAGKIHILTAEYSRCDRTAQSLRQELANTIRFFELEISPDGNLSARSEKLV